MDYLNMVSTGIDEAILDRGYYLQSLLQAAAEQKLFTEQQIQTLQYGLIGLMAKEVERYTNGESSSVPVEKAQELLQSITYQIGVYLKTIPDMQQKLELLKTEKPEVMFYRGMELVTGYREKALQLLTRLQENDRRLASIAYQDTVYHGIPEFFHDYNIEYGAHEMPGAIDYPLMNSVPDYLGVEFVYEYLKRLTTEDRILDRFSSRTLQLLVDRYDREAEHLLINLCELAMINALGCELLGKELSELLLSKAEVGEIMEKLSGQGISSKGSKNTEGDRERIQSLLQRAMGRIGEVLLLEEEQVSYLQHSVPELASRLKYHLDTASLESFFIRTDREREPEEELYTGEPMEDEKLRELIMEIGEVEGLENKVLLIQEQVRSIADLIELLEECFFSEEYPGVYQLLGYHEVTLLKKSLMAEAGSISIEDYEPRREWQRQLLLFSEDALHKDSASSST
jgi:hypothetical protein